MEEINHEADLVEFLEDLAKSEFWHDSRSISAKFSSKDFGFDWEAFQIGMEYTLDIERESDESAFRPMFETSEGSYPPSMETLNPSLKDSFVEIGKLLPSSDLIQARFGDLLWVLKWGDSPYLQAMKAFESLLRIAISSSWQNIYKSIALRRAFQISRELNKPELESRCLELHLKLIGDSLTGEDHAPGVVIPLIEDLIASQNFANNSLIKDLIDSAIAKFESDVFNTDELYELRLSIVDSSSERLEFETRRIAIWEGAAATAKGFISQMHLQRAIELAHQTGNQGEVARLRASLQSSIETSENELTAVEASIDIPKEDFDKFIDFFCSSENLVENLTTFGTYGPLSTTQEEDIEAVQKLMAEFPLQHLFTRVLLDSDGYPIKHISTKDEKLENSINANDNRKILLWGQTAIPIFSSYLSNPEFLIELRTFFLLSEIFDEEDAERILRAIQHYIDENWDECVHLLFPRIELILRKLLRSSGRATYREPFGSREGRHLILGEIFKGLQEMLPSKVHRYFRKALIESGSLNLRNRVLHGLLLKTSKVEAILVIHIVMQVACLRLTKNSTSTN
jgi:hypothetical protein